MTPRRAWSGVFHGFAASLTTLVSRGVHDLRPAIVCGLHGGGPSHGVDRELLAAGYRPYSLSLKAVDAPPAVGHIIALPVRRLGRGSRSHPGGVLFGLVSGAPGGGQRIALAVGKRLAERGVQIFAVAPDAGPAIEEFQLLGARTAICGPLRSHSWRKAIRLAHLMRQWGVGTVYTHTPPVQELVLAAAARMAGTRVVLHRHIVGHLSPRRLRRRVQLKLWRQNLRTADEVICVSRAVQAQVAQVSSRTGRIVPNGVPIPPASSSRTRAAPLVAFVGRLDPNKRVEDFLQAAAKIHIRHPEARFAVVGSGIPGDGYEAQCRALARDLLGFDEREIFLGPVPRADEFLQDVDVLVLPSQLEGHPIVLLEAMARAKAVVVTDIDGCRETVEDRVHGRVVPVRSPLALADAVSELLDSPSERFRLGKAARKRVLAEFSEERMVDQLVPLVVGE